LILANLRADGSKERKIPHGFLFEYVTSPNYTCEILAWIGFSVMTQSWAGMCTATDILTRALTHAHTPTCFRPTYRARVAASSGSVSSTRAAV